MRATGTIENKTWESQTVEELAGGGTLIRMTAADVFHGDIDAEARAEFVALTRTDNSSSFAGMYRISGSLSGRGGCFLLQTVGASDADGTSRGTWQVVAGSATGALAGLRGKGGFTSQPGGPSALSLDYELDDSLQAPA